ncbi:UNVERIFIED_CONTAM: Eukaryotic translation initiation factor 4B3 [Sesamum angustifolium]|uniref:Eukaryotic translation initiation factor 4B3 n=1 Tax=Sesamum angustifolium TaxID=2727405 RepID=A0AAW2NX65_9LAMI
MSCCFFLPAHVSGQLRSSIGISWVEALDLTVAAPGTNSRAVREALIEGEGEKRGFFSDSQSRADEVDNWASKKSFVPSEPRRYEKRGGFGLESGNGGADSSNWVKRKEEEGRKTGGAFDSLRERKGGFESNRVDSESWGRKREEGNGGSRPRLNLQPRTLPVDEGQKNEIASAVKPKGAIHLARLGRERRC